MTEVDIDHHRGARILRVYKMLEITLRSLITWHIVLFTAAGVKQ